MKKDKYILYTLASFLVIGSLFGWYQVGLDSRLEEVFPSYQWIVPYSIVLLAFLATIYFWNYIFTEKIIKGSKKLAVFLLLVPVCIIGLTYFLISSSNIIQSLFFVTLFIFFLQFYKYLANIYSEKGGVELYKYKQVLYALASTIGFLSLISWCLIGLKAMFVPELLMPSTLWITPYFIALLYSLLVLVIWDYGIKKIQVQRIRIGCLIILPFLFIPGSVNSLILFFLVYSFFYRKKIFSTPASIVLSAN